MKNAFDDELFRVYESFKRTKEVSVLTDYIRLGGLINKPWPVGLAEDLADILDHAYPWTSRKQTQVDDTWIFYLYWRETEFKTGKVHHELSKSAIRSIEDWFAARGTPKKYETIRTRLREHYELWRKGLTKEKLRNMENAAGGGE